MPVATWHFLQRQDMARIIKSGFLRIQGTVPKSSLLLKACARASKEQARVPSTRRGAGISGVFARCPLALMAWMEAVMVIRVGKQCQTA